MNGKNIYDVTYSFDIVISKLIDSVVDLLSNFTDSISANSPNVIQIKEAVGDFKISVNIVHCCKSQHLKLFCLQFAIYCFAK